MSSSSFYRSGRLVDLSLSVDRHGSQQVTPHRSGGSSASPAPSESSWGLVNQKLEQLIGFAQQQKEEMASIKGEIAFLRVEMAKIKEEQQAGGGTKRNPKLPTDLSVSTSKST